MFSRIQGPPTSRETRSASSGRANMSTRIRCVSSTFTGNSPTLDAQVSGGIVLASSESFGGSAPSDTVVRGNLARANTPADLVYDGSGQNNRLTGNGCETSVPDGLCR
jgi:hypothetical protein